ncbi:MAG: GNAT family N-acetyltransferase [Haloarculaceae archaeon]
MDVRTATPADRPAIRDVARRSIQASYSLSPGEITAAIEAWYDEVQLEETLEEDNRLYLVATVDEQVVGFSESALSEGGEATLLWLHVDPAYRGEGVGSRVLAETRERLEAAGAERIYGRVLQDNATGNSFFEAHGFEWAGRGEVEIGDRTFVENMWVESGAGEIEVVDRDGEPLYVDYGESETGSIAHFHVVYADRACTEKYGYYCSNCGALANAMDPMGRIECDDCGNARKPTRWDAAYM